MTCSIKEGLFCEIITHVTSQSGLDYNYFLATSTVVGPIIIWEMPPLFVLAIFSVLGAEWETSDVLERFFLGEWKFRCYFSLRKYFSVLASLPFKCRTFKLMYVWGNKNLLNMWYFPRHVPKIEGGFQNLDESLFSREF